MAGRALRRFVDEEAIEGATPLGELPGTAGFFFQGSFSRQLDLSCGVGGGGSPAVGVADDENSFRMRDVMMVNGRKQRGPISLELGGRMS